MSPFPTGDSSRQRRRATMARLERIEDRVAANERATVQLRNTIAALAREADGISVCHPCTRCDRSLLLVQNGSMFCPCCGFRSSM